MANGRRPALHLHMPAVDDLARGDGAAASLGAYLDLSFRLMRPGAMILAGWAMSCAISERSSWKRCGFDASGGRIRRTREGAPRLCGDVAGAWRRVSGVCTTPAGALARRAAPGARCSEGLAPPLGRSPPRPTTSRRASEFAPVDALDRVDRFGAARSMEHV
jgi:hypothetical protein